MLQVAAGLAGDYNAEGVIDAADYTVWRDAVRASGAGSADGNGDLHVDQQDYVLWKTNLGASLNLAVHRPLLFLNRAACCC